MSATGTAAERRHKGRDGFRDFMIEQAGERVVSLRRERSMPGAWSGCTPSNEPREFYAQAAIPNRQSPVRTGRAERLAIPACRHIGAKVMQLHGLRGRLCGKAELRPERQSDAKGYIARRRYQPFHTKPKNPDWPEAVLPVSSDWIRIGAVDWCG